MSTTKNTGQPAHTEAEAIIAFAEDNLAPQHLFDEGTRSVYAVPEGHTLETIDVEKYQETPASKRGTVVLHTPASFARYVKQHTTDGTAVYADIRSRSVVGLLNGHEPGGLAKGDPGWGDHRVSLSLQHTPEWNVWAALDGKLIEQDAFAYHIEERLIDIVDPPGAHILELAQSFQAHTSAQFRRAQRLDNGETQLTYEETIDAKAGHKGQIEIPAEFTIVLVVFEGGKPVELTARLRYRIREGHLLLGFQIVRKEDVVREAFAEVVDTIEKASGVTPFDGAAPASGR